MNLIGEDQGRQWIEQAALDHVVERAHSIREGVTGGAEEIHCLFVDSEGQPLPRQVISNFTEFDVHDPFHAVEREGALEGARWSAPQPEKGVRDSLRKCIAHEGDDLVDLANELWREMATDRSHHQVPGVRFHRTFSHVAEMYRAQVARHDNDNVSEVDRSALPIFQSPKVHDLLEKIDNFPASFLNLVDQYDAVRLVTNVFRQLTCNIDASEAHSRGHGLNGENSLPPKSL